MEYVVSYVLTCLLADWRSLMRNVSSSPTCVLLLHVEKDPYLLPCKLTSIQAQLGPRLKLPSPPASRTISYLAQYPHTTYHPSASRILRGKVVCNLHLINAFFPLLFLSPSCATYIPPSKFPPDRKPPSRIHTRPRHHLTLPFPSHFFPCPAPMSMSRLRFSPLSHTPYPQVDQEKKIFM